jgi:uncharacterized protein (DUF885 family)
MEDTMNSRTKVFRAITALAMAAAMALSPTLARGDEPKPGRVDAPASAYVPDLPPLVGQASSELRPVVERYISDRAGLSRRYAVEYSPERRAMLKEFYTAWQERLQTVDFHPLSQDARVDYILLKNQLAYELALIAREEKILAETAPLIPFSNTIIELQETRRRMTPVNPAEAAATLARLGEQVDQVRKGVEAGLRPPGRGDAQEARSEGPAPIKPAKTVAYRAAEISNGLRRTLEQWFRYYAGYDPLFTWWTSAPYKKTDDTLRAYIRLLRERVLGIREGDDEPIVGDPIGREALLVDLAHEMIPYSPEDLLVIADREFAWCEAELKKAAREMGFGDDWKAALEKVKTLHVEPGKQPHLIRDLALEAIEFVEKRDLVTVPPLARDIWRIEMMTPERQKQNPFFTGGEVISVSFPTDTMAQEDKLMSMRGNNIHFARATVFHELIPGHHLQGFMTERYQPHRRAFATPFWGEGWALHWEMLLWDLGFPKSPENRIGMLFWRTHRAARIKFSLSFHLGLMTPQQCIDFLVDRVGHERANATAEVRRSFAGNYSPLYQVAYMMGALQFRALHKELVGSGKLTNRQFHDAILQSGRIPLEMVRALLTKQRLAPNYASQWNYAGEISARP